MRKLYLLCTLTFLSVLGIARTNVNLTNSITNNSPTVKSETKTIDEDSKLIIKLLDDDNLLKNDKGVNADDFLRITDFTVDGVNYSAGSYAKVNNKGIIFIGSNGRYRFNPALNFNGDFPVVTYTVTDGTASAKGTLTLKVKAINDAPQVSDEVKTTAQGVAVNVTADAADNLLKNDVDVDGDAISISKFTINGTDYDAGKTATLAGKAKITVNADGSYNFVPNAAFNTSFPTVTYTVVDGKGGESKGDLILIVDTCLANNNEDCDNDGVSNGSEQGAGTKPDNPDSDGDGDGDKKEIIAGYAMTPCKYTEIPKYEKVSEEWKLQDCDGDGIINGVELLDGTNPDNPDSDGDGVNDKKEKQDNTDSNNVNSYLVASQDLSKVTDKWRDNDYDEDKVPNGEEITNNTLPTNPDTDGDGVDDGVEKQDGTDATKTGFCSYKEPHQNKKRVSQEWKLKDCDDDKLFNGKELELKTDPRKKDTDGDGVDDFKETNDGTNPLEMCEYLLKSQDLKIVSTAWNNNDCDNDGITNGDEINNKTNPLKKDTDGDGVADNQELKDGTDSTLATGMCDFKWPKNVAGEDIVPDLAVFGTEWKAADCDDDGVNNEAEIKAGTKVRNPDTDGDGVLDGKEITDDNTDPNNACSLNYKSQTIAPSEGWLEDDCDGDGIRNGMEVNEDKKWGATDPIKEDTDDDGVDDGQENVDDKDINRESNPKDPCSFFIEHVKLKRGPLFLKGDCDGDGWSNEKEYGDDPNNPIDTDNDGKPDFKDDDDDGDGVLTKTEIEDDKTDPLDWCSFVAAHITETVNAGWAAEDCDDDTVDNGEEGVVDTDGDGKVDSKDKDSDNDGNPDGKDPNRIKAVAQDDDLVARIGETGEVNILENDDFLPGPNTTLSQVGGTAKGVAIFDPKKGTLVYAPAKTDALTGVTLEYQVCNTGVKPADVCTTATVNITVLPEILPPDPKNNPEAKLVEVTITSGNSIKVDMADYISDPKYDDSNLTLSLYASPMFGRADIDDVNKTITYTSNPNTYLEDKLVYQVTNPDGLSASNNVVIKYTLIYPDGFSPNGDGINDTFVIVGINAYPNNSVKVFNRWGNKVFEAVNYKNTWDGKVDNSLSVGSNLLPEGLYYYVLDLGNGEDPIKKTVYINY